MELANRDRMLDLAYHKIGVIWVSSVLGFKKICYKDDDTNLYEHKFFKTIRGIKVHLCKYTLLNCCSLVKGKSRMA